MFDEYNIILFTFAFIILDFATGYVKGLMLKNLSSSIMREGLFHKFGYVLIIILSILIEAGKNYINSELPLPLIGSVCSYIILTETVSILENVKQINPQLGNLPIFAQLEKPAKSDKAN